MREVLLEDSSGAFEVRRAWDLGAIDFGIDLVDRVFGCLQSYLAARERGEYDDLSAYLSVLAEQLAGT